MYMSLFIIKKIALLTIANDIKIITTDIEFELYIKIFGYILPIFMINIVLF